MRQYPRDLFESELFGHEKGAFTGAISQKVGRLELADQGTMFLDEVGDVPLEIQPKLLRALQEREFERLGSTRTKKVDVRLVAATNRDLESMIATREFRSDLYYRLNVFPIRIPPLRERREDIPVLARYFAQNFAQRMQKQIETIPAATMRALTEWDWPGNVRELGNFIERAVILTRGRSLEVPLAELRRVCIDEPSPIAACFGSFPFEVVRLVISDALSDQISRALLCVFDLIASANPAGENASAKENISSRFRLQPLCIGTCADSTPQRAHDLKSALRVFIVSLF